MTSQSEYTARGEARLRAAGKCVKYCGRKARTGRTMCAQCARRQARKCADRWYAKNGKVARRKYRM